MTDLYRYEFDVVFSDGGSTDTTCECIRKWQIDFPVSLICRQQSIGLSNAVLAAASASSSEFIVVLDADLSHPPEMIPVLLEPMVQGLCSMTLGSRYCRGGCTPDWPQQRRLLSLIASVPARMLTGMMDPLTGFFALRREILTVLEGNIHGFKIALEILVISADDLVVKEIPIVFHDRHYGYSKMCLPVIASYIRQLFALALYRARNRKTF